MVPYLKKLSNSICLPLQFLWAKFHFSGGFHENTNVLFVFFWHVLLEILNTQNITLSRWKSLLVESPLQYQKLQTYWITFAPFFFFLFFFFFRQSQRFEVEMFLLRNRTVLSGGRKWMSIKELLVSTVTSRFWGRTPVYLRVCLRLIEIRRTCSQGRKDGRRSSWQLLQHYSKRRVALDGY